MYIKELLQRSRLVGNQASTMPSAPDFLLGQRVSLSNTAKEAGPVMRRGPQGGTGVSSLPRAWPLQTGFLLKNQSRSHRAPFGVFTALSTHRAVASPSGFTDTAEYNSFNLPQSEATHGSLCIVFLLILIWALTVSLTSKVFFSPCRNVL